MTILIDCCGKRSSGRIGLGNWVDLITGGVQLKCLMPMERKYQAAEDTSEYNYMFVKV